MSSIFARLRPMLTMAALYVVTVLATLGILKLADPVPAQAAPPSLSDNCTLEGTANGIETFFCEGDMGPDYLTNSVGFTVALD